MNTKLSLLPSVKSGAHVGILGGSFDPPHLGHQLLALSFLALEPIDELWVIPCANHASKGLVSDFTHRLAMCTIAFARMHNVRVLDVEQHLEAPSYTINTIDFLGSKLPSVSLHFGIGSDLVNSFETWHGAARIAEIARIVVFERDTYPVTTLPPVLANARLHRGYPLPDVNSTRLRELRKRSVDDPLAYVDRGVAAYIAEHQLFR